LVVSPRLPDIAVGTFDETEVEPTSLKSTRFATIDECSTFGEAAWRRDGAIAANSCHVEPPQPKQNIVF